MDMYQDPGSIIHVETEKVAQIMNEAEENIVASKQKQNEYEEYISKLKEYTDSLTSYCATNKATLDINGALNMSIEEISAACRTQLQQTYDEICENIINENILKQVEESFQKMEERNGGISEKYLKKIELVKQLIEEKTRQNEKDKKESIALEKELLVEITEFEQQISDENNNLKDLELNIQDGQASKNHLENDIKTMQEIEQIMLTKKELEDKLNSILELVNNISDENTQLKQKCLELINHRDATVKEIVTEINTLHHTANQLQENLQVFIGKEFDLIQENEGLKVNQDKIKELTVSIEENYVNMDDSVTANIFLKEDMLLENMDLVATENEVIKVKNCEIESLKVKVKETEKAVGDITVELNKFKENKLTITDEISKIKDNYGNILLDLDKLPTENDVQKTLADMQVKLHEENKLAVDILENEFSHNTMHIKEIEIKQNDIVELENKNKEIQGQINQEMLNLNKVNLDKLQTEKEQEKLKAEQNQVSNLSVEINKIKSMKAKFIELKNHKVANPTVTAANVTDFTKPETPVKAIAKNKQKLPRNWDSDSSVEGEINCLQLIKSQSVKRVKALKSSKK